MMANRKSTTSVEVKNRWKVANYKTYQINLRYDVDQDLIDFVERYKAKHDGQGVSDIFRAGIEAMMEADKN